MNRQPRRTSVSKGERRRLVVRFRVIPSWAPAFDHVLIQDLRRSDNPRQETETQLQEHIMRLRSNLLAYMNKLAKVDGLVSVRLKEFKVYQGHIPAGAFRVGKKKARRQNKGRKQATA